jgi:hypothetical protein
MKPDDVRRITKADHAQYLAWLESMEAQHREALVVAA